MNLKIFKNQKLNKFFVGFFIIAAFFVWLLLLRFNTINTPFMRDEGEYAYAAQLLHSGGVPYKESFMQKPPMIIYVYYLAQLIDTGVWVPRLFGLISLFFIGLIVFDILRREYNIKTAISFLFIFPPMICLPPLNGFFAQPEIFLLLPFSIALWCYFKFIYTSNKTWLFCLGIFLALSILFKPTILFASFFLFIFTLGTEKKNWFKKFIIIFSGGIMASFVVLLPIVVNGGLLYMWESAFVYNYHYAKVASFNFSNLNYLFQFFWPLFLFLLWFVLKNIKNKLLFLGLFLYGFLGVLGGWFLHYYILTIPIVSIIYSIVIVDLVDNLKSLKTNLSKNLVVALILLSLTTLFTYSFNERFFLNSRQSIDWFFPSMPFNESVIISSELNKISSKNDKIFIFGSEPQILYYSDRKSMTRFVITYPLHIYTALSLKYQNELIEDIKNNYPEFIITYFNFKQVRSSSSISDPYEEFMRNLILNDYIFVGQTYFNEMTGEYEFLNHTISKFHQYEQNNLFLFKRKNLNINNNL